MKVKEIVDYIEGVYPTDLAMDFDNVGLLVGSGDAQVGKILISLDPSFAAINYAIDSGVDLLLTHHPLMIRPIQSITDQDGVGRKLLSLIQNNVAFYALHTNYDVLRMAEIVGEKFALTNTKVLLETALFNQQPVGLGIIGDLPGKTNLGEFCQVIKNRFDISNVKVFGDVTKPIDTIAISPGSGRSVVQAALAAGVDVLVTGDIGHHDGLDSKESGMAIVDAGHYATEAIFLRDMELFLQGIGDDKPEVIVYDSNQPFLMI